MQRQLMWRKVLPLFFLFILTFSTFSIISIEILKRQNVNHWQAHLMGIARQIVSDTAINFDDRGAIIDLNWIETQSKQMDGISIQWLNLEGFPLEITTVNQTITPNLHSKEIENILTNGEYAWVQNEEILSAKAIYNLNEAPAGFVLLKAPFSNFEYNLEPILYLGIIILLAGSVLVFLIFNALREGSRKPIENLTLVVDQMRLGNFHQLNFPVAPGEFIELSNSLRDLGFYLGDQINTLTNEHTKLSAVLNQMSDGVLIADPGGKIQLLNPAAERLFQVGENQGLGRSVVEVLRYQQLIDLWRIAKEGQRESTMLEIGAQRLFLQVTGMPLKTLTKGTTLILFQNFTQVRRLETVRRDFISNVSHELRTPLASLKALAETLQEGALDDPPAARRFITRMEMEIDSLTLLVNELLELSRIESGKVPLAFHRTHPCDLLSTAYERMVLQAERAGLTLIMDCPPELPLIFADTNRISQVIINLIHNAIKFTSPEGKIIISAFQDSEFVIFSVKDTGVGMPKEDLTRIFERFYKADRARTSGGTGLGLSIARHMVESHGGLIWAESEQGTGTTIFFSLPIA